MIKDVMYLAVLTLVGLGILFVRRKASGGKTMYKLMLLCSGILLSSLTLAGNRLFDMSKEFLQFASVFFLIIIMYEISSRMNSENINLSEKNISIFFAVLFANVIIIGTLSTFLLYISPMHAIVLAILMSIIEYFFIDGLKMEGDLTNPLMVLFAIALMVFNQLPYDAAENSIYFVKYLLIGLGMGVISGIIAFKSMKKSQMDWIHEIGIILVALATYLITEQLNGSGIFAVMILGIFYGNSHMKHYTLVENFSPFIYKSLEIMVFILLGFAVGINASSKVWIASIAIFTAYVIIRYVIMHIAYKYYSWNNKLLMAMAPKGLTYAAVLLVLASFGSIPAQMSQAMLLIMAYSLIASGIYEYIEERKIDRLERIIDVMRSIRYGRKRDLKISRK